MRQSAGNFKRKKTNFDIITRSGTKKPDSVLIQIWCLTRTVNRDKDVKWVKPRKNKKLIKLRGPYRLT